MGLAEKNSSRVKVDLVQPDDEGMGTALEEDPHHIEPIPMLALE